MAIAARRKPALLGIKVLAIRRATAAVISSTTKSEWLGAFKPVAD
jgi:hypothetical protein